MLLLFRYNQDKDSKNFTDLLESHKLDIRLVNHLPTLGYIVYKGTDTRFDLVAAGFLNQGENGLAFFDCYITNSEFPSKTRHQALNMITKKLVHKAYQGGKVNTIIGFTGDQGLKDRLLMEYGFDLKPDISLFKKTIRQL